jgi:hypothetical protein
MSAKSAALYDYSCDLAVLSRLASRGHAELTPDEHARRACLADRAVAELRRAIDRGFRDAGHIARDPDYDSIRSRADFKGLLADLIFPVDPFAN